MLIRRSLNYVLHHVGFLSELNMHKIIKVRTEALCDMKDSQPINFLYRLSFWLSNSIMLRAIVSQTAAELPHSNVGNNKSKPIPESDDWEDVLTFIVALEKIESWLFSRIVESLWWQVISEFFTCQT